MGTGVFLLLALDLKTGEVDPTEIAKLDSVPALSAADRATLAWDDENWQAFLAFLVNNGWVLLLVALLIALVAAMVWYVRAGSFRRAPVPAFLMAALLLHVVGGLGSFYVFVPGAREFVDERFIVLKEIILDDEPEAEDLETLEEMPELKPVEPVQTEDLPKQVVETISVPRAKPLAAAPLPARLTLEALPEESLLPKAIVLVENQPDLDRLALALPSELLEKIEKEQIKPIESTDRKPPAEQKVRVELTEQPPQPIRSLRPPTPQKISDTLPRAIVKLDATELLDVEPVTEPVSPQQRVEDVELAPRSVAQLPPVEERVTVDRVRGDAVRLDPPSNQRQSPRSVNLQLDGDFKTATLTPPTARSSPTKSLTVRLGPLPTEFKNAAAALPIVTSSVDDATDSIPARRANIEFPQESVQVKTLEAGSIGPPTAKKVATAPQVVSVQIESQPGPSSPSTVALRGAKSRPPVAGVGRPRLDSTNGRLTDVLAPLNSTAKAAPVKRSGLPSPDALVDEPIKTIALAPAVPSGKPTPTQPLQRLGVEVDIQRGDVAAAISAAALDRLDGSGKSTAPRLVSGQLARVPFESTLSPSDPSVELARSTLWSADLLVAEESIGLQQIFRSRRGEAKRKLLLSTGGNDQSELAVQRGLIWLDKHQAKDGRWTLHRFGQECKRHGGGQCNGHGSTNSDAAATGFALLPFLGAGNTHREGDYRPTVDRGLKWLVSVQKSNGDLYTGGNANGHMYSHAIATIALCEAYGMTGDPALRGPAQKAIDFIVAAQHKPSGGWRYRPNQKGDTSVVGWQVMALKSGQMATPPLNVPQATLDGATKWLDSVEGQGNKRGQFGYQGRGPKIAMTAEGLLCRKYLGSSREDANLRAGADYLLKHVDTDRLSREVFRLAERHRVRPLANRP
ncbi:MAG: hypothetical protein IIA67_07455 [Planctomycetes bacterium]|nr:hypothetical protein [Planctomycetota bacterium]